jgi:hypothetical protein
LLAGFYDNIFFRGIFMEAAVLTKIFFRAILESGRFFAELTMGTLSRLLNRPLGSAKFRKALAHSWQPGYKKFISDTSE